MNDEKLRQGLRLERVRSSAQFRDGRFQNTRGVWSRPQTPSLSVMGEFFFGGGERVPKAKLPVLRPHETWATPAGPELRTTWLGHSTVLLELDGKRVLTDPVFGERSSPVGFVGPRRFHPVPAQIDELPQLSAIVLSHDHFDHLCSKSMRALARLRVPVITALGVGALLESFGHDPACIHELDWHQTIELDGLRFTATPAQHFSGRGLGTNRTLWASWVIASERRKVFFSGDTGLTKQFKEIGEKYGPFDLVMLEVGAFHPAWGAIHLGPENALKAFSWLGGGRLLPVHWGTFNLALHDWDEPAETLYKLASAQGAQIVTPRLGEVFWPSRVEAPDPWWRDVARGPSRVSSGVP